MYSIDIKNNKDIYNYCMQNGITDITKFVQDCFKQGYDIKKYGLLGKTLNEGEKNLKNCEIKEIRVEVPVDRIVERIVNVTDDTKINELLLKIQQLENRSPEIIEVPIEVIKEVEKIVTKIEYISDKTTEDELGGIIAKLKNEINEKDLELEELKLNLEKTKVEIIKEVEVIKEIEMPNEKVTLLQQTIQNLNIEIRNLKNKIKELEKTYIYTTENNEKITAKFYANSNLNNKL